MPSVNTTWQPTPSPGLAFANRNRVLKRRASGHQRSRGKHPGTMQLTNGTIDAGGEAKVVRIDDEAGSHEMVLRRTRMRSLPANSTSELSPCGCLYRRSHLRVIVATTHLI